MTSAAAQRKQHEIKEDIPFVVTLMGREYKCRYLKEWTAGKISYLIAQREPNPTADVSAMVDLMKKNNTIASKCVSMLILGSYWKIRLLHWWFWRKLYRNCIGRELTVALTTVYEALDLSFFFQNMILIEQMNILKKKMTKIELKQLSAELQSERNPAL
jgi:hypothetical protein